MGLHRRDQKLWRMPNSTPVELLPRLCGEADADTPKFGHGATTCSTTEESNGGA
jgi:hypothetical protein